MRFWTISILILALVGVTFAADDGKIKTYSNGFRLGSDGTKLDLMAAGTVAIASGGTSATAAVTSAKSGDIILVSPSTNAGASQYRGSVTTNVVTITANSAVSTTATVNYVVIGK